MTVYIVDIESIPTRYTSQWKQWIPDAFSAVTNIQVIEGSTSDQVPDAGSFFNWGGTNLYKSQQSVKISELFVDNKIKNGDRFLFTDGWHPAVVNLRQMIATNPNLNDVLVFGLFHAGSYDPHDILGKYGNYFKDFENSLLDMLDGAFFATEFSLELMASNRKRTDNMYVTGFPYNTDHLYSIDKNNNILFPHRISPEKHLELFELLSTKMPKYNFIVTSAVTNNKDEYHKLLAESKYTVSFSEQETWGISVFESLYSNCIPIVPDILSYTEMYTDDIKYKVNGQADITWVDAVKDKIDYLDSLSIRNINNIIEENKQKMNPSICIDKIIEYVMK